MQWTRALVGLVVLCAAPFAHAAPPPEPEGNEPAELEADLPPYVEKGDLKAIGKRGVLRVLDEGAEENMLAREGRALTADREMLREFAARHDLRVQFIAAPFSDLIPMLKAGKGDVVADSLTVTPDREAIVAFTHPVAISAEVVVGRKGGPAPTRIEDVRRVDVRPDSSYAKTLAALKAEKKLSLEIAPLPANVDPESAVYQVGQGELGFTVVDSHLLRNIEAYNDRVQRLFPIAESRQIAWAVRPDAHDLLSALDAYIAEKALTAHADERSTGDLPELKKRGSLRVLTRNNPVTYFLHRGQRFGFDYELAGLAAKAAGLRLEMVVVPSRDQLIPWLLEGRGDVIAASLTETPERAKQVAFTEPYMYVDELLVQRAGGPKVRSLQDLKGKKIHVRPSSSYARTLELLQPEFGPFEVVPVAEDVETEEIIARLAAGEIDFTVADSHIFQVEHTYRPKVASAFKLPLPAAARAAPDDSSQRLAFAVRPGNPQLLAFLDGFVRRTYKGLEYNMARSRYFENKQQIRVAKAEIDKPGTVSPYDKIIKKHSKQYGFDWRLMAAQAYQESHFDPKAKSWVGAKGLFQVMPATGKGMGFTRLEDPEVGSHAGIRYMKQLVDQIDERIPLKHRVRFALAAYNVGLGHVLDAQRLATELKLDPFKWFGHVEKAMLLLQQPKQAARARHGYCRGEEPVKYVSEIQNRYDNYVKAVPE